MDAIIQFDYKRLEHYNHREGYDKLRKVEKADSFSISTVYYLEGDLQMFLQKKKREDKMVFSFQQKRVWQQVQKIFIITIMLAGFNASISFAEANENEDFLTIYHIYSAGDYIGGLSDIDKLEQLKEEKLEKATSKFEDLSLNIGNDLSFVPERVFNAKTDDQKIIEQLQPMLVVKAEAMGIQVDEELVVYVKDQASYDKVVHNLKLQAVSEKELAELEAFQASSSLPPLAENETRITDLIMSNDLKAVKGQTDPSKVLTVEEAIEFLNKGKLEEKKYTVQLGDVLGTIAKNHNMTTAKLIEINEGFTAETVLQPDEELNVTVTEPFVEIEVHYESKKKETMAYKKITEKDDSVYKGDHKVTQKGSNGEKMVTELIRKKNGQVLEQSIEEEKTLIEPKDEVTVVGTKELASRGTGSFIWPASGGYISSQMGTRWGRMHQGIDIARPSSYSIFASDSGVVVSAGNDGTYGNKIVIDHKNGYRTLYAHLASINVTVGQTVPSGATIGVMGKTGRSTGVHLHFEVTKNGTLVDPMTVLR